MPHQAIDLDIYQDHITELYHDGKNQYQIAEILCHDYEISVSYRTVQRRLTEWGLGKRIKPEESPEMDMRISALFFQSCLSDDDILKVITHEGFIISRWNLVERRKKLGLLRKVAAGNTIQADTDLIETVRKAFSDETIQKYGRGMLWTHFRSHGNLVSRYILLLLLFFCCS